MHRALARPTWWDGLAAAIGGLAIFTAAWYYGGLAVKFADCLSWQVVQTVEAECLTEEDDCRRHRGEDISPDRHPGQNRGRVSESDCPGRDCVHTGTITRAGQSIVCLPEQVVRLSGGGSGFDARCWDRRDAMKAVSPASGASCTGADGLALGATPWKACFP